MSRCDTITEALVMGEPLSAEDQAHVDDCDACRRLTALPMLLASTGRAEPPRPGFSARMMAVTRDRLAQRQRRRFAAFTLALAAAGVSAIAVDRRLMRDTARPGAPPPPVVSAIAPELRQQLESLHVDDFDAAMAPVAPWDDIEAPVHNYRVVLRKGGLK